MWNIIRPLAVSGQTALGRRRAGITLLAHFPGIRLSSLGIGPQVSVALSNRFELRGAGNFYSLGLDTTDVGGIDYSLDLKWRGHRRGA